MSKLNAIKTTTIKSLKGAGAKVKDGTLYVTDSIENGVEKGAKMVSDLVSDHSFARAERNNARIDKKAEKFGAKAEAWQEDEMDLKASGKCTAVKKNIVGHSYHCGKDVMEGEYSCWRHLDKDAVSSGH